MHSYLLEYLDEHKSSIYRSAFTLYKQYLDGTTQL